MNKETFLYHNNYWGTRIMTDLVALFEHISLLWLAEGRFIIQKLKKHAHHIATRRGRAHFIFYKKNLKKYISIDAGVRTLFLPLF